MKADRALHYVTCKQALNFELEEDLRRAREDGQAISSRKCYHAAQVEALTPSDSSHRSRWLSQYVAGQQAVNSELDEDLRRAREHGQAISSRKCYHAQVETLRPCDWLYGGVSLRPELECRQQRLADSELQLAWAREDGFDIRQPSTAEYVRSAKSRLAEWNDQEMLAKAMKDLREDEEMHLKPRIHERHELAQRQLWRDAEYTAHRQTMLELKISGMSHEDQSAVMWLAKQRKESELLTPEGNGMSQEDQLLLRWPELDQMVARLLKPQDRPIKAIVPTTGHRAADAPCPVLGTEWNDRTEAIAKLLGQLQPETT